MIVLQDDAELARPDVLAWSRGQHRLSLVYGDRDPGASPNLS